MDDRPKKTPQFGPPKRVFKPNLGYKRNVAKDPNQQPAVEVKIEYGAGSGAQSSPQKQKKPKEKSLTQIESVFSNMGSTSQGRTGSLRMGLSSGFQSYSKQGNFNSSGSLVKIEPISCETQSIQQMQLFDNNELDIDDPMNNINVPVRLPLFKKDDSNDTILLNTSLEYPSQENVHPLLSELLAPELLMTLQFYDSSFTQPKISDIDLTENGNQNKTSIKTENITPIKVEFNGHNVKTEKDSEANYSSQPVGKVQYYRSGRVVLLFNDKEYELLKANEDKHHKELISLTKIEDSKIPDKCVSLGTVALRLKAVMDIGCIIENFMNSK